MKKIFAVLLAAACCASGAFCAGVQLDAFFGGSNGFDAGSVFGSGKLKSTIGVIYESHETEHEEFVHSYFEEEPHSIIEKASYFGPFYKLDYAFDFLKLSDFSRASTKMISITGVSIGKRWTRNIFALTNSP